MLIGWPSRPSRYRLRLQADALPPLPGGFCGRCLRRMGGGPRAGPRAVTLLPQPMDGRGGVGRSLSGQGGDAALAARAAQGTRARVPAVRLLRCSDQRGGAEGRLGTQTGGLDARASLPGVRGLHPGRARCVPRGSSRASFLAQSDAKSVGARAPVYVRTCSCVCLCACLCLRPCASACVRRRTCLCGCWGRGQRDTPPLPPPQASPRV